MKYGNCLCGAVRIMWEERNNRPGLILRVRPGSLVPHFMIRTKEGLRHYRVVRDLFPWPLCYLLFEGRFQTLHLDDERDYVMSRESKVNIILFVSFISGILFAWSMS